MTCNVSSGCWTLLCLSICQSFTVAEMCLWNSWPVHLCESELTLLEFCWLLKTRRFIFLRTAVASDCCFKCTDILTKVIVAIRPAECCKNWQQCTGFCCPRWPFYAHILIVDIYCFGSIGGQQERLLACGKSGYNGRVRGKPLSDSQGSWINSEKLVAS